MSNCTSTKNTQEPIQGFGSNPKQMAEQLTAEMKFILTESQYI